jgi:hypothetical protein
MLLADAAFFQSKIASCVNFFSKPWAASFKAFFLLFTEVYVSNVSDYSKCSSTPSVYTWNLAILITSPLRYPEPLYRSCKKLVISFLLKKLKFVSESSRRSQSLSPSRYDSPGSFFRLRFLNTTQSIATKNVANPPPLEKTFHWQVTSNHPAHSHCSHLITRAVSPLSNKPSYSVYLLPGICTWQFIIYMTFFAPGTL